MSTDKEESQINRCEICNKPSDTGMIDENSKLRYTCQNHYVQLYEKINRDNQE